MTNLEAYFRVNGIKVSKNTFVKDSEIERPKVAGFNIVPVSDALSEHIRLWNDQYEEFKVNSIKYKTP